MYMRLMLLVLQALVVRMGSTRSGARFLPYEAVPIYCAKDLDFSVLLRQSTAVESEFLEDGNEGDEGDDRTPASKEATMADRPDLTDGPPALK
ncbi:hypothetical protein Hypma_011939 [Hypsizygus marmoreus]|uniref:Secreted protein n=1 Tax=Hypsizygus marmoreus TaxID=39966 RepID=A0A369JH68_HYPMA|nr:hypothetical protein Hypma_011939 [Hypsizygus marmoreus]